MDLKQYIRAIPDFPTAGILFRDITPLLGHPTAFRYTIERLAERFGDNSPEAIAAIESRGFMFGAPLAVEMRLPFVPIRKEGRLPYRTNRVSYQLEYGADAVEIHVDAIPNGSSVLLVDDLLATGGTMKAAAELIEATGGEVVGIGFVIELVAFGGRNVLESYDVESLVAY